MRRAYPVDVHAAAAGDRHRAQPEAGFLRANRDRAAGKNTNGGTEGDVTEVVPPGLDARRRDVGSDRIRRCAHLPSEVALQNRGGCKGAGGMP